MFTDLIGPKRSPHHAVRIVIGATTKTPNTQGSLIRVNCIDVRRNYAVEMSTMALYPLPSFRDPNNNRILLQSNISTVRFLYLSLSLSLSPSLSPNLLISLSIYLYPAPVATGLQSKS